MTETYTPPSIANFNDNPPDDNGDVVSTNLVKWSRHIDEIGTPLKNYIDAVSEETDDAFERINARNARNILEFDADPTGATSSQTALDNARSWLAAQTNGATLIFPTGIYSYSISPNWALDDCRVIANGTARLRYTGTGNAFILDGGAAGGGVYNMEVGPFIIEAPSTAGHGVYMRSVQHSHLKLNVRGCGTSEAALYMEWGVANTFYQFTTSVNEVGSWYLSGKPAYGIYMTDRGGAGSGVTPAYNQFITPIIEGVNDGIYIDYGTGNLFTGGTSEGNTNWGVYIVTPSNLNKFVGMDFEANTTGDMYIDGAETAVLECDSDNLVQIASNGQKTHISGGAHDSIQVDSGADGVRIIGSSYNRSGSGTISDAGLNTRWIGVVEVTSNVPTDTLTASADDTTPSVAGGVRLLYLPANTGATAITDLDDGVRGQIVTLVPYSSTNTPTIADGGNFALSAAWSPSAGDSLTVLNTSGFAAEWTEIGRSTNS